MLVSAPLLPRSCHYFHHHSCDRENDMWNMWVLVVGQPKAKYPPFVNNPRGYVELWGNVPLTLVSEFGMLLVILV